jgi:hypothetical protein
MDVRQRLREVRARDFNDAPETTDKVRGGGREGVESKISKRRIHLGVGVASEKTGLSRSALRGHHSPDHRHTAIRQRIAGRPVAGFKQHTSARISVEIAGVASQLRYQHNWLAGRINSNGHKRHIRMPSCGVQRGECGRSSLAH